MKIEVGIATNPRRFNFRATLIQGEGQEELSLHSIKNSS
ncbi:hypothetical protein SAMN05216417_102194 [Nitrosospira multiformis]|uniref:Uncharacterized protein n=1 Tax=Nitrosospira multiformis TaxID=1231 RepID=A0A1I7FT26_9PROT|nr:hypothetical protein SAMN05216417_102194 [Nitrosospira multiformis]